jgi:hypothetical protein
VPNATARHLALPTSATPNARTTRTTRRASRAPKPRSLAMTARGLLGSAVLLVAVTALALTGTGATYAMWNGQAVVNASSVSSASTGLTVNGTTAYEIPAAGLSQLSPGQSVMIPLTLTNTGTTKLSTAVSGVVISADTQGLASRLTARITQSATCTASTVTGTRLATFSSIAAPYAMAVGASIPVCIEIKMDLDAPMTVAGGLTTFTMNLTATQARGA